MGERSSVSVADEILEFKSLNLQELMKENDEDEIREDPAEVDSANRRQTMGSILVGDGSKTLRDVIQSDRSKAWEPPRKCRKISGTRILKNVFRVKKKFEEEEGEESAKLLGAKRSPSVVDSARLHGAGGDGAAAIRVFLVGRSPSDIMDGAAANRRIPWRFLKRKPRLRNIACGGRSRSAVTEQSSLNSAVPVVLPATEESDDAISWNNSGALQEHDGNISRHTASETHGNTNQSRAGSCVNAEPPANLGEANTVSSDRPAGGGRQPVSPSFDRNLEESDGSTQAGMNLAAALAAERQLRAGQDRGSVGSAARNAAVASAASAPDQVGSRGTPFRVSLMSLLEEANERSGRGANGRSKPTTASSLLMDGSAASAPDQVGSRGAPFRVSLMSLLEETNERSGRGADGGSKPTTFSSVLTDEWQKAQAQPTEGVDPLCCVCMVRRKGAAFIPCGHTFCRFCSRELWVSRGSCPLCNRCIMEILDIF